MSEFRGMEDVSGGVLECVHVNKSVYSIMEALKGSRACIAAGDNGAISIYINDSDEYVCEFSRYCIGQSKIQVRTKKRVKEWLKEWLPACDGVKV